MNNTQINLFSTNTLQTRNNRTPRNTVLPMNGNNRTPRNTVLPRNGNNRTPRNTVLPMNGNNGTSTRSRIPLNEHGNPKYSGQKKEKKVKNKTIKNKNATNTKAKPTKRTKNAPIFNIQNFVRINGEQMPKELVDIINSNCLESQIIKKYCFNPLYDFPSIFNMHSSSDFNYSLIDEQNNIILINDNVKDFTKPFHYFRISNYILDYLGEYNLGNEHLSDEQHYNQLKTDTTFNFFKQNCKNIITKYLLSTEMCEIYGSAEINIIYRIDTMIKTILNYFIIKPSNENSEFDREFLKIYENIFVPDYYRKVITGNNVAYIEQHRVNAISIHILTNRIDIVYNIINNYIVKTNELIYEETYIQFNEKLENDPNRNYIFDIVPKLNKKELANMLSKKHNIIKFSSSELLDKIANALYEYVVPNDEFVPKDEFVILLFINLEFVPILSKVFPEEFKLKDKSNIYNNIILIAGALNFIMSHFTDINVFYQQIYACSYLNKAQTINSYEDESNPKKYIDIVKITKPLYKSAVLYIKKMIEFFLITTEINNYFNKYRQDFKSLNFRLLSDKLDFLRSANFLKQFSNYYYYNFLKNLHKNMFPIALYTHFTTFYNNKYNIYDNDTHTLIEITIDLKLPRFNLNIDFPAYVQISSLDYSFSDCCEQTILNLICYLLYDYKTGNISNENIDKMIGLNNNHLEEFKLNTFLLEMREKNLGEQNIIINKYKNFVPSMNNDQATYAFNISNSPKILFQKIEGLTYLGANTELQPSLYNLFSLILYITGKISELSTKPIDILLQMFIELCTEFGKQYQTIQFSSENNEYGIIIFEDITIMLNITHAEIYKRIEPNGIGIDLYNSEEENPLILTNPKIKKSITSELLFYILDSPLQDFEIWYKSQIKFEPVVIANT